MTTLVSLRLFLRSSTLLRLPVGSLAPSAYDAGLQNVCRRGYSMYAPTFVEPIFKKSDLEKATEIGVDKELEFTPIKAALTNQTSSIFHDTIVTKFTNYVMKAGGRVLARDLLSKTFEQIKHTQLQKKHKAETEEEKASIETNPIKIFHKAVENSRPVLHLTPVKRGGIKYQVPIPLTENRSYFIAMRWLVEAGKDKFRTMHFPEKLAKELIEAASNELSTDELTSVRGRLGKTPFMPERPEACDWSTSRQEAQSWPITTQDRAEL